MIFGVYGVPFIIAYIFVVYGYPILFLYLFSTYIIVIIDFRIPTVVTSELLKNIFKRERPPFNAIPKRIFNPRKLHDNYSFPSGDCSQVYIMFILCSLHVCAFFFIIFMITHIFLQFLD